MLKDNQLSTVLLLIALGFLIYYLTKPKTVNEGFAEGEEMELPEMERVALPEIRPEVRPEVRSEIRPEVRSEMPEIEPELLNQILEETERPKTVSDEITGEMDIFKFQPNDNMTSEGADLDSAFQRPIEKGVRPDTVDLNRNNVKKYDARDFLPKEINDEWFDTDFSQAKFNINDDILINTERYVIGVNTVGQSLKNASYDIRGTIPNPKFTVSPWNNSTYEPDFNLKSLC